MSVIGDNVIIEAILKGENHKVLHTLYQRTLPKVKSYILKNGGNLEDVKDIFQDAVIALIKKIKLREFNTDYDIDGFLYVIARNRWINRVKVANRTTLVEVYHEEGNEEYNHLEEVIQNERDTAIYSVIDAVKEPCATLLRYTIFQELPLKEVAEKMNYSSAHTAKIYNYRCKKRLMDLIKETPAFQQLLGKTL